MPTPAARKKFLLMKSLPAEKVLGWKNFGVSDVLAERNNESCELSSWRILNNTNSIYYSYNTAPISYKYPRSIETKRNQQFLFKIPSFCNQHRPVQFILYEWATTKLSWEDALNFFAVYFQEVEVIYSRPGIDT